jgi:hypothetical protein
MGLNKTDSAVTTMAMGLVMSVFPCAGNFFPFLHVLCIVSIKESHAKRLQDDPGSPVRVEFVCHPGILRLAMSRSMG